MIDVNELSLCPGSFAAAEKVLTELGSCYEPQGHILLQGDRKDPGIKPDVRSH